MGANIAEIVVERGDARLDGRRWLRERRSAPRTVDVSGPMPSHPIPRRPGRVALARDLADRGGPDASGLIDELVSFSEQRLAGGHVAGEATRAAECLLACCIHLGVVGRNVAMSSAADVALAASARAHPRTRFRAERLAFAIRLGSGDLRGACVHAERAYHASFDAAAASCKFEGLTLVVALLEAMGLARDAKELAVKLTRWPADEGPSDALRLLNALYGLRLCRQLDDVESAASFHAKASHIFERTVAPFGPLTTAVFEAAKAAHLVWIGKPRVAARRLRRILAGNEPGRGYRAIRLLRCAEADVRIAIGEADGIERSIDALTELRQTCPVASSGRQEIERTLVRLHLRRPHGSGRSAAARLLAESREQPGAGQAPCVPLDFLWWTESDDIDVDPIPTRAQPGDERDSDMPLPASPSFSEMGFDLDDFIETKPGECLLESEATLRTAHYELVEGWAIAAEVAAGGTGRQCFKVGRVAGALGAALGFSAHRCVTIDMACRLRDIGRTAVGAIGPHGDETLLFDRAVVVSERAKAAGRILSFSQDPIVRVAARIAQNCRAWWNGSGYPSASTANGIPIEARICAVADALVELVDPIDGGKRWAIPDALNQIRCLSGVQFDPELVALLGRVMRAERADAVRTTWRVPAMEIDDPVAKVQENLFETLEVAS